MLGFSLLAIATPAEGIALIIERIIFWLRVKKKQRRIVNNAFRYIANDYNYGGDNEDVLALPFEIDEETGILTRAFSDRGRRSQASTAFARR